MALPNDIIYDILPQLHDDMRTLYRCLLVNRLWCRITVPILWCRPFTISSKPFTNKHRTSRTLIIQTYVSCLNQDELAYLIPYRIDFLDIRPTLFPYEKYLQELSDNAIDKGVKGWFQGKKLTFPFVEYDHRAEALTYSLWRMFMRQCVKIQSVSIMPLYVRSGISNVPNFSDSMSALSHVRSFTCRIDWSDSAEKYQKTIQLLQKLELVCKKITHMKVYIHEKADPGVLNAIVQIIRVQKGIKEVSFKNNMILKGNLYQFRPLLVPVMESQAKYVTSLAFRSVKFNEISIVALAGFHSLESLCLQKCRNMTIEHSIMLSTASFRLKFLSLLRNSWSNSITAALIAKAGVTLQQMVLDNVCTETTQAALDHCPNLTILYIEVSVYNYSLITWIGSTKIQQLEISFGGIFRLSTEDTTKSLQLLREHLPTSVVYLKLDGLYISNEAFTDFINNCKAPLSTLIISIDCYHDFEESALTVLNFASKRKTLKKYGNYDSNRYVQNVSIRELEKHGIKILNTYDIKSLSSKAF
ncbi:1581_t:CDS:1 [Dentiscutata erythropus]|uniref:1581_t:CDS:1 n=1 Tax=Dentiscutata erythropus TaxID=1348616 RepID=A0A9N9DGA8_9GLOM|nr:1581_t:CDS:1 [Dentiscutata erythropus]